MYLYTNEKAQKTAFLQFDVQKRRRMEGKKCKFFCCKCIIFLLVHEVPSFEFGYINPYFFCIFY